MPTIRSFTLNYNAENCLVSVTGAATASFVYDGDGKQIKATVNGTTTVYVGNHYEVKNSVVTKYYFAGATRLAVRTGTTLSFLLSDHIGSSSVTANASGVKTASALYKAFGETRYTLGALGTDYKFTGQREQAEIGLYFYGARWFDPSIGRFTQPDTIVPTGTQGTQAWDRYAYVNNNPVRYNDPTGHVIDQGDDGGCTNLVNGHCPTPTTNPLPTSTPTCPPGPSGCAATQTAAPTATATPTATPGCPVGQTCIGNPQPTSTPNPTTTPMFYNEVNAVADYCFGSPDLSGNPGCGQLVDMGVQAAACYGGFNCDGSIAPIGQMLDLAKDASYVDVDISLGISSDNAVTGYATTYVLWILFILFV